MKWLIALLLAIAGAPLAAQDSMPPAPYAYRQLEDPAQEAKARALMETLRCLKCQSQSIADSDASMAGDMRNQVRMRIQAGQDPEAAPSNHSPKFFLDEGALVVGTESMLQVALDFLGAG